jgi:hypothetical protein
MDTTYQILDLNSNTEYRLLVAPLEISLPPEAADYKDYSTKAKGF